MAKHKIVKLTPTEAKAVENLKHDCDRFRAIRCLTGKKHIVDAATGICRICFKPITKPKPWIRDIGNQVGKMVLGS